MGYTQPQPALPTMSGTWWAMVLRGIVAVLFGLAALFWPGLTLFVLLVCFGVYALVDGLLAIVAGIIASGGRRWLLLAEGTLGFLAGLVVLFWPGTTALVLVYVISAWAIFTGLLKVLMGVAFRRAIENGWLMILGGLLSVLFGIILGAMPGAGLVTLVWLVGVYALILGVALVVLGFLDRGPRPGPPPGKRKQGQLEESHSKPYAYGIHVRPGRERRRRWARATGRSAYGRPC